MQLLANIKIVAAGLAYFSKKKSKHRFKNITIFVCLIFVYRSHKIKEYQFKLKYYKYRLAANTISLLTIFTDSLNLFSRSVFPILLDAWINCLSISSKRLIALIILPEKQHYFEQYFIIHNTTIFVSIIIIYKG